jgi:hypothetical protein
MFFIICVVSFERRRDRIAKGAMTYGALGTVGLGFALEVGVLVEAPSLDSSLSKSYTKRISKTLGNNGSSNRARKLALG